MKNRLNSYCIFILSGLVFFSNLKADDYKQIIRLYGYWKFSVGDNPDWANPGYNDNNWDNIYVPASFEKNGYEGYNGYAWYRKSFQMADISYDLPMYLMMGKIDDVDEVYLNGKLIGKTGVFPPDFETAWSKQRQYLIPKNLLKTNGYNVIAVRLYDTHGSGGIRSGNIGIFVDNDYYMLDLPLNGQWKFMLGNKREWREKNFNDSGWKTITVPSSWDSQGYNDYDGYGCYRLTFKVPQNMKDETKYLSLGKIDDIDEVYFNGTFIGSVYDLVSKNSYSNGREYAVQRFYYIPENLINYSGNNVIAVVVYDGISRGGIYEGPIGIISETNYNRLKNRKEAPSTFWEILYEWLVE